MKVVNTWYVKLRDPCWRCGLVLLGCLLLVGRISVAQDLAALEEIAMQAAVNRVAPAVVKIETFGGQERVGRMLVGEGPTTGLILTADGYIVSSAFNFVQKPSSILVTLPNDERLPAKIVARDHSCMLMLLKVEPAELLAPPVAVPAEEMLVGQWAITLGRTFDSPLPSQSVGILSALNRIWGKAIQTDANVSPSNYGGPLLDLQGRVFGVLVPLSPDAQNELAGSEWYDSGIGFAVPLADINARLERMKLGDLYRGVMGITLEGKDIYGSEARIAACQIRSPAYLAGLRAGDVIVSCDGAHVERQAQLKHALGTLYAGDVVQVTAMRGEQRLDFEIELTDKLTPFVHPFLGVLPDRAARDAGVAIRYVFAKSGADAAGLQEGDVILMVAEEAVADAASLRAAVANLEAGTMVPLAIRRAQQEEVVHIALSELPQQVPLSLPSAYSADGAPTDARQPHGALGEIDIRIPEEPNECFAYIPETYVPERSYGVIVHLATPGSLNRAELLANWRPICDEADLIVVAPQPTDGKSWQPTEVDFIRKALDFVGGNYRVDPLRVVIEGNGPGGSMAYLTAFRLRDVFRGVVATDAAIPRFLQPPDTDPVRRLAFFISRADSARAKSRIDADIEMLQSRKHPVTVRNLGREPRVQNDDERHDIARWIDALDRI